MPSNADLHMHSTISDGRLTPTQLLELAQRNGVHIINVTHDLPQVEGQAPNDTVLTYSSN